MPSSAPRLPLIPDSAEEAFGLDVLSFDGVLKRHELSRLVRGVVNTLQVNVGKRCNMACQHCHVEAGPQRAEIMTEEVGERVIELLRNSPTIRVVDITGGAPELNPNFRRLVNTARSFHKEVIDRCNLSILLEPGQEDLADFLASEQVHIVASLPCYQLDNVDRQRGKGAFDKSMQALQVLNRLGYGKPGSGLTLDLVYNPTGPFLPPPQAKLEEDYKRELGVRFGIEFNHLLTITNMPIRRFAHALERDGRHAEYMTLLRDNFNPTTVREVMCRSLLSVAWDGRLYDCDFNQMLELPLGAGLGTVWELERFEQLERQPITTRSHCFGCTAGSGSSCSGALG